MSTASKTRNEKFVAVAIGFRVKTGRATAVVMAGPADSPRVLLRKNVQLFDPAIPESHQPWHADLELPAEKAAVVVPQALKAVDRVSASALRELVSEISPPSSIVGIALVAGSGTDPESIRNPHMRAHAREGQLFPNALAAAAKSMKLPSTTHIEADVFAAAAKRLGKTPASIKLALAELGREVGKPWSSEEKCAAAAAWIALAG